MSNPSISISRPSASAAAAATTVYSSWPRRLSCWFQPKNRKGSPETPTGFVGFNFSGNGEKDKLEALEASDRVLSGTSEGEILMGDKYSEENREALIGDWTGLVTEAIVNPTKNNEKSCSLWGLWLVEKFQSAQKCTN